MKIKGIFFLLITLLMTPMIYSKPPRGKQGKQGATPALSYAQAVNAHRPTSYEALEQPTDKADGDDPFQLLPAQPLSTPTEGVPTVARALTPPATEDPIEDGSGAGAYVPVNASPAIPKESLETYIQEMAHLKTLRDTAGTGERAYREDAVTHKQIVRDLEVTNKAINDQLIKEKAGHIALVVAWQRAQAAAAAAQIAAETAQRRIEEQEETVRENDHSKTAEEKLTRSLLLLAAAKHKQVRGAKAGRRALKDEIREQAVKKEQSGDDIIAEALRKLAPVKPARDSWAAYLWHNDSDEDSGDEETTAVKALTK